MAKRRKKKYGFSFSWRRLLGIQTMKQKIARATGIPTTRQGRQRKVGRIVTKLTGKALLGAVVMFLLVSIGCCGVGGLMFSSCGRIASIPTPSPSLTVSSPPLVVTTIYHATNVAAVTVAHLPTNTPTTTSTTTTTPTPLSTATLTPTLTITPTRTMIPSPTFMPTVQSTATAVPTMVPPTESPPPIVICGCSSNIYNCSDFITHNQAQACYNYCISQGRGDVHDLDRDNDGSACENLP